MKKDKRILALVLAAAMMGTCLLYTSDAADEL